MPHRLSLLLLALLSSALPLQAQTIRRPIRADSGRIVLVQFFSGGQTDARGKGIAVVDAAGQPVAYRILAHDPEGETCLAIDLRGKRLPLALLYGPKPLSNVVIDEKIQPSLVLQTYPLTRKNFRGLGDLLEAINAGRPLGTMLAQKIDIAYNPFGADENFITLFEGLLDVPKEQTRKLFSVSDDAAFVEIDGKVLISQTAPNVVRHSEQLAQQAVSLTLSAGTHRIRYVHVQTAGASLALLGHMVGERALPLGPEAFVHDRLAELGPAQAEGDRPAVGFDARQLDQMGHEQSTFSRFLFRPIAAPPASMRYRWNFGDGTTTTARYSDGALEHVFVFPPAGYPSWKVVLELVDAKGSVTGQAAALLKPSVVFDMRTIRNAEAVRSYVRAMSQCDYARAEPESMAALYTLAAALEEPAAAAPITEPFIKRFGDRGGPVVWEMKYSLATFLARDDPARAEKLFAELSRSTKETWQATCAMAEQMDLRIFRLGAKPQEIHEMVVQVYRDHTPRERALLKARVGDAYRQAGKMEEAATAYREAQRDDFRQMDARKASVLERAYRETALGYLQQRRLPALRQTLLEWEADFPLAKLGGDLPLLTGRFFQAVGDDPRAIQEFQTLIALNPLHPSLPEITFRLAQSLERTGKKEEAGKLFAKVAREYPHSPFAAEARGHGS